MTNLSPELCEKVTTSGGELTLGCAKCLRSVNRVFHDKVASMILEMNREPTSNTCTPNERAQWMVLASSGILNVEIAAGRHGPQLTPRAKMSVYTQIFQSFCPTRQLWHGAFARQGLSPDKVAFINTFSRVLMDVCEDKGFNREVMRKIVELAMKARGNC